MTVKLDHLVVVAPDLAAGGAHIFETTGLEIVAGGEHVEMATHNRLLGLGDIFLEAIAVNPAARAPKCRRWFAMDENIARDWTKGNRFKGIVARTNDLAAMLAQDAVFGVSAKISRGDRVWRFGLREDGAWPLDGALPCLIDWGPRGSPAPDLAQGAARLKKLVLRTPHAEKARTFYKNFMPDLAIEIAPAPETHWRALLETPNGVKILT